MQVGTQSAIKVSTKRAPIASRFFKVKRSKSNSFMCSTASRQVGSIFPDGAGFWASALRLDGSFRTSDVFPTFAEADVWLFQNYA